MSDSWISWNPRIEDPSKPYPSSNPSSVNSEMGTEKCCIRPGRSQNRKSTISAPACFAMSSTSLGVATRQPPSSAVGRKANGAALLDGFGDVNSLLRRPERSPERSPDVGGPVANPPNRLDQVLVLGAELGAEPPDVHVHRAGAPIEVVPPHFPEELGPGEHSAGVLSQEPQQLELFVRQVQGAGPRRDLVGLHVDGHGPEPH